MPAPLSGDATPVAALLRRVGASDPVALTNAAWFAARRGDTAAALDCARRAAELPGAPRATFRTLAQLVAGRIDQLLLALPVALDSPGARAVSEAELHARATDSTDAMLARGRMLLENGLIGESLAVFDTVLSRRGADPVALFHRGVALAKLRRYDAALDDWDAVERADPAGPLAAMSRRHSRSARTLADLFSASV